MDPILLLNLVLLVLLIVGSEFAVVKVRMSRIDQLIDEGNKKAVLVKKITSNLDYYLSACQLGITVTALGLGWLGEPTIERLLHPTDGRVLVDGITRTNGVSYILLPLPLP